MDESFHRESHSDGVSPSAPVISDMGDTASSPEPPAPRRGLFLGAAAALILLAGGAIWVASQADPDQIEAAAFDESETAAPPTTASPDDDGDGSEQDDGDGQPTAPAEPQPLPLKTYELNTPLADPPFHPEAATEWWNSEPLTRADLDGRVVLFDFWTFGCINCRNTLPSLRAWHERYADDGLLIIGVHTAEFNYEKEPANIEEAIADLGVEWPVVNDPNKKVWRAFNGRFWPTKAIYDTTGTLRYAKKGEGRYAEVEDYIRDVLEVDPDSPRSNDPEQV